MATEAATASGVTVRQLPKEEWERLRPLYEAQGDELPYPNDTVTAVVAEINGRIIGMAGLNVVLHAGPLFVFPEFRGKGVAGDMFREVESIAMGFGAKGLLTFPSNNQAIAVMEKLGLEKMPWAVYRKDF